MDYAAESRQQEIVEDLMKFFLKEGLNDCFSALLFKCYDLLKPDVVLELAWRYKIVDYAMPFMIQAMRDFGARVFCLNI
jgi:clathrin heavy chain